MTDVDNDKLDDRCDPCVAGVSVTAIDFNRNGIGDGCEVCFEPPIGDVDRDGLDDACDSCLKGPPHDEDGDLVEDACDNCPLDPNPDQASLGGTVGDACNPATTAPLERAVFEPFLVRDLFRWNSIAGTWTIEDDRASLAGFGQRRLAIGFTNEFRFTMNAFLGGNEGVSVEIKSLTVEHQCSVSPTGQVTFGTDSMQLALTGPLRIEIHYSQANIFKPLRCRVRSGTASVELSADPPADTMRITVRGNGEGKLVLDAVDLVTTVPPPPTN